ncbi:hypothetical protein LV84_00051 [Algoriphagus ratkowskyi]|uniref:Deoxyribose-phosphate aldolase n=1 Tax=Algoriphagus ratkowskyi TaxID=57028 RepID=A0A2W7RJP8_9BACT|nr:DUF6503 family protein [Algoriphagus ratkowskyi]PZX61063.1 hypothetical protein LV84_00051 [Algoriphagus ratkowskyi]TXD79198.1 hypothetical protein ESW18_02885 [Algoriphagus ratkowskyi]
MRLHHLLFLVGLFLFASCDSRTEAEKIVDRAIAAHGGDKYENSKIEFDFRNIHYTIFKTENNFEYIREFSDSTGNVVDMLNNEGFVRTVNGAKIDTLSEEWIGKYSRSVNSVAYFAFLPFGLNDASVFKSSMGETEINGEKYDLIRVTFAEEGGGDDFDDVFLYWIGKEDSMIDFIAYSYHTDGGGVRMREVSMVNEVGGIRFQNYLNLKPADETMPVEKMQELYEAGELSLLSEINLENIKVESLNN